MNTLSKSTQNREDKDPKIIDIGYEYEEVLDDLELMKININKLVERIKKDPSELDKFIRIISERLEEAKNSAQEMNARGFWERLVSSNTRDISKILISQNDIMTSFFTLLQAITFLCKGNSEILVSLMDTIRKSEFLQSKEQKELYEFTKSYLEEAIRTSESEVLRENVLKKLLLHAKKAQLKIELLDKQINSLIGDYNKQTKKNNDIEHQFEQLNQNIRVWQAHTHQHYCRIENLEKQLTRKSFFDSIWYKGAIGIISISALAISIFVAF